MQDEVRNAIAARIADGSWAPGTRLKQLDLAELFNVSQAPVREALRELEGLGILVSDRYRGVRVREIDLVELGEAYELRAEIEDAAARRAVPCREERLQALEADIATMESAFGRDDLETYLEAAVHFHRTIVEMSGNRVYLRAWEQMAWDIRVRLAVRQCGMVGFHSDERAAVVTALRAGDGEAAGRRLRELIGRLSARVREASS